METSGQVRQGDVPPTTISASSIGPDIIEGFDGMEAWRAFLARNRFLVNQSYIRKIVNHVLTYGIDSEFLGKLGPDQVKVGGENFRETLCVARLNPRQRAIMELIANERWSRNPMTPRIYAAEAVSPFALAMRGRFPFFIGSEYVSDEEARRALYPILFQDLTDLTLPSNTFDCVITNDCLEHVPDIARSLAEMARVLRPGGVMLSTFPFSFRYENIAKARLVDGQIELLTKPEYHGNPAEPAKGSLVFTIPGWQIIDLAKQTGFSLSELVFVSSMRKGITALDIAGIFVMRCYK